MKTKPVILAFDDEPQNIELLEAYLVPQGYEMVKAASGKEALGKLSDNQIDLILLGVMMPGMDGFEVLRRVRQDKTHRLLPRILVTALRETEYRIKGIEAGCDDFISYPFDKSELLDRIRSLLRVKACNELMSNYQKELESEVNRRTKELKHALKKLQQDITERKRAEEALRESEERFRLLIEQAPDAIAVFDVDENRFIQVNSQAEKLFGCSRKDLLTSGAQPFYTPIQPNGRSIDESRKENMERALAGEEVVIERAIHNAEGKELICELRIVRFPSADRRLIRNSYVDITERKQSGEKIKASLLEKETMLKEIHHRVKNNLQVIQSLLNLQARKIKDPQALEVINQSRDRIRAMALVHEKLYQSPDLAHIDMTDYLQGLSISLFHSSQVSPNKVKLKLAMEEVQLGINEAIPLGLILNELISNALKHAFPGGREGEIRMGLALVDEGMIRLSVRDNGIGLPGEVDFCKAESMGFQVVSALVEQLGGSIELDRELGTEFRITFLEGIK